MPSGAATSADIKKSVARELQLLAMSTWVNVPDNQAVPNQMPTPIPRAAGRIHYAFRCSLNHGVVNLLDVLGWRLKVLGAWHPWPAASLPDLKVNPAFTSVTQHNGSTAWAVHQRCDCPDSVRVCVRNGPMLTTPESEP